MNRESEVSIVGDLCLGSYPASLAELPRSIESMRMVRPDPLVVSSSWFDLTMLSYLAMLIRSCKRPEASLTLRFDDEKKLSFLWRSGFFGASRVGHRGSPFNKVEPDIWSRLPKDINRRANFTPLIVLEVSPEQTIATQQRGYSEFAREAAKALLTELEKTLVFSLVERTDLMESKEYLYVVLWELVQNVIDHARATHAIIAAQVFYKGDAKGDRALAGLRVQHDLEEQHCVLPLRKDWLTKNRDKDYLMLTCVDNGRGIPGSIREKDDLWKQHNDEQLLGSSFQRESSKHDTFEHRYELHGLHLIAQLISSYQGYLFAQSGAALFESAQQGISLSKIDDGLVLPGAAFQILLPLSAGEPRPYVEPQESHRRSQPQQDVIFAVEELRKKTTILPPVKDAQQAVVDSLIRTVSQTKGALFLDFVGMPRERHFNSLLLLCIRRKKTDHPVIVLNSSDELFTAIRGLRLPKIESSGDKELRETNWFLATDLTRNQTEEAAVLPLLVAVTKLRDADQFHSTERLRQPGIAIQWLGIADDGPHGLGSCVVALLDELFRSEDGVDELRLENLAASAGKPDGTATTLLRNIQRANPNLLNYSPKTREWHLAFNASSLYFDSVESLTQRLRSAINSSAKYVAPANAVFFLNWRRTDCYLSNYYQLWKVVRDAVLARIAATLLLRLAHDDIAMGPQLLSINALISVTPSAGLLARELARILRVPHWEAASVYDLDKAEWPADFDNNLALIVDDLIDTGTASRMVMEELTRRKARCAGVVSVLASVEGCEARRTLNTVIVSLMEVELGRPTKEEIKAATILDVDPHTLEPRPQRLYSGAVGRSRQPTKKDLVELARYGGLRSGHFVYGGHHYYEFFDIVRYIETREGFEDLWAWFKDSVSQWHSRIVAPVGGSDAPVAIIYPYYSPIAAFLHRIQALVPVSFGFECSIHVARPYQRTRQRVGYRLDSLGVEDHFAVFVDDGIASGGTLSEIVDEFVSVHNAAGAGTGKSSVSPADGANGLKAAFLALPVFDRIGMTPRKHLKSIAWYRGDVRFDFEPRYSLNLRAYYAKDCPLCRIDSDIANTFRTYEHVEQQLAVNLSPVRDLLSPTYLTPIATCAPGREMGLLSKDDTASVVNASDALFSDLTSGSDIRKSIEEDPQKSSVARLEILLHVMMDPILYRSIHDVTFFAEVITRELWRADVSEGYRAYFLMHMSYLHYGRHILLVVIPQSLRPRPDTDKPQSVDGEKRKTPTQYFDKEPLVFPCILAGIWLLRNQEQLPTNWDEEWRKTLRGTPYGHQFACGTSLTEKEAARAFADMLLCNFVTHYRSHHEALPRRLEELRNLIDDGRRTNVIPKHSLAYLETAIETVRTYYGLEDGLLSSQTMKEMLSLYDQWVAGNDTVASKLRAMVVENFAPEQTRHDAVITGQLLDGLAQTTDNVIAQAKVKLIDRLQEQLCIANPAPANEELKAEARRAASSLVEEVAFSNDAAGLHVFGNTRFIVIAIEHLLQNAFESELASGMPLSSLKPAIELSTNRKESNGRDFVRVSVISSQDLRQDDVDRCFRAGGGLMAQKQVIEGWGGEMGGRPTGDKRTEFFIGLEVVNMERKAK